MLPQLMENIELIALIVLLFTFFVYTLYHAVNNPKLYSDERLFWVLIILLTTFFGWIAYWKVGKNGSNRSQILLNKRADYP